jgi:NADP-dependent 3-hydroxy acid dehydrogenase YdfG
MKDFKNKVAVITGAANGFGVEFAKECAKREMKIVLADIDSENLKKVDEIIKAMGAETLAVTLDVTVYEQVQALADKTIEKFGQVDLLFNNAGVVVGGAAWDVPVRDWDWIIGTNVNGLVYGAKAFIPTMLKQDREAYIVNTASVAGLLTSPGLTIYHTTKHAAVALTESMYYDLQAMNSKIKMSVFCPGFVQTDLHNSYRHRPERFAADPQVDPYYATESYKRTLDVARHLIETGMPIDTIASTVFAAIEQEKFYITTHPEYEPIIGLRTKNILEGKNPDVSVFNK